MRSLGNTSGPNKLEGFVAVVLHDLELFAPVRRGYCRKHALVNPSIVYVLFYIRALGLSLKRWQPFGTIRAGLMVLAVQPASYAGREMERLVGR